MARNSRSRVYRISKDLPVITLRELVVFPHMIFPLVIGREKSIKALEQALMHDRIVVVVTQKDAKIEDPSFDDIYSIGVAVHVMHTLKLPDGTVKALVEGLVRVRINNYLYREPYLRAEIEEIKEHEEKDNVEIEALKRAILSQFEKIIKFGKSISLEAFISTVNIETPGRLADIVASHLNLTTEEKQGILETFSVLERLRKINTYLTREVEILELEGKIQTEVRKELEKSQKEFFLRKQMEVIQKELGDADDHTLEIQEFKEKIEKAQMPDEVREKAERELSRLQKMHPSTAEAVVVRTYLDWLVTLPWKTETEDNLDIKQAAVILDEDHYGLKKVKERILEFLAVRQLTTKLKSPILNFVGPPGVGKTSMGKSIARALGRKFVRISLGGVRDEAEIRGHRRTYIGALPGRILQGMRNAGTINPVFMLDEVDKIGMDFRGDPSAALLEVLDPEQNHSFSDHYLDVPYDLSKVLFICTSNILDTIPSALRDRMEIIHLPGYIEEEKLKIANMFLVPKQLEANGLTKEQLEFEESALQKIIREYTREAGVRNLEREISSVCRKVARRVVEGNKEKVIVRDSDLHSYLGPVKYFYGIDKEKEEVGVATGLAYNEAGGDVLLVESTLMEGKGNFILTGQLGEVMQESAKAAFSYVRSRAAKLNIPRRLFEKYDIHVHVPAGAIPKDGPSAGITIATSIASLLTNVKCRRDVAMTGEITLRGRVLPVGGIKEKVLSAHRAGIKTVILPKKNEKDLEDIPKNVQEEMNFIFVESVDEVLDHALRKETE